MEDLRLPLTRRLHRRSVETLSSKGQAHAGVVGIERL